MTAGDIFHRHVVLGPASAGIDPGDRVAFERAYTETMIRTGLVGYDSAA